MKAKSTALQPVEQAVPLWTPRQAAWWQACAIAILTVLSVAEQYVIHILGREDLEEYLITFDLDAESNLPTWYSSMVLLVCAVLLGRIATVTRRQGGRFAGYWRALSIVFAFLSLDEIARIHEHLGRLHEAWHTHGIFYFAWVIPGAIAVLVFAAIYTRFVFHLPSPIRWRFVAAGAVFVVGALVVEALGGWRAETMGMNNMTHSLIATVEEVMELTGAAWFLVTLLRHLESLGGGPGARAPVAIESERRAADPPPANGRPAAAA